MKCPFGYTTHKATWRCYVIFAADWCLGLPFDFYPLTQTCFWVIHILEQ
jgi:hypothetical protein